MAHWRVPVSEMLAWTDEQFNALIQRLVERKAREREAMDDGGGGERVVDDGTALAELGVVVQPWPGKQGLREKGVSE